MRILVSLLAALTCSPLVTKGQSPAASGPSAGELQRAAAAFARGDWATARAAYQTIATGYPRHALARFRLGVALLELGNLDDAEMNLREGERLGMPAPQAAYRLAQLFAVRGAVDSAIVELARAAESGLTVTPQSVTADAHLKSLQTHPRWPTILAAFDAAVFPCRHDSRFRQFDFWVGDWDVRPTGQPPVGPPARNTVTLDDNDCVITEHWSAASGSTGQSFNIFDRSYGEWRQTWVDNIGGQHDYRGHLVDGNMVFVGDTPAPNGKLGRLPTRLTFFNLGRDSVRQFSEVSTDSGRSWQVSYDLTYVRRHEAQPSLSSKLPPPESSITDGDRAIIRSLDSTFVRAWLRDDTLGVLGLFAADAVLLPPNASPVVGCDAIRAWWFPTDGSHTRILSFERRVEEIGGTRDFAFVRGSARLRWSYRKSGKTTMQSSRSTDLILLARTPDGGWKIVRQMWNTLPRE